MKIVQKIEKQELDFLSESEDIRSIITALESLDEEGGVMIEFDNNNQKTTMTNRIRNYYNGGVSVKKVEYGDPESHKYIIYFNDKITQDYRGSASTE